MRGDIANILYKDENGDWKKSFDGVGEIPNHFWTKFFRPDAAGSVKCYRENSGYGLINKNGITILGWNRKLYSWISDYDVTNKVYRAYIIEHRDLVNLLGGRTYYAFDCEVGKQIGKTYDWIEEFDENGVARVWRFNTVSNRNGIQIAQKSFNKMKMDGTLIYSEFSMATEEQWKSVSAKYYSEV